jgi:hypothetical protein
MSMQDRAAGYALTTLTILKLQRGSWTVVALTTAKFKPLILYFLGMVSPCPITQLHFDGLGLHLPTSYITELCGSTRKEFWKQVHFADQCAPVKVSSSAEKSDLQVLHFQEVNVRRELPGGTAISHYWPNQRFVKRKFIICT